MTATLVLIGAIAIPTTTYYVAGSGNDLDSGLSDATPWRNLTRAAGVVSPGDTVLVMDGTYSDPAAEYNRFEPSANGNPGSPITLLTTSLFPSADTA